MPKLKTYQALRKRIKITKKKKILIKAGGQDHFNARESSRTTMGKRRRKTLHKTNLNAVKKLIHNI
jgi:ribosomal protein L35